MINTIKLPGIDFNTDKVDKNLLEFFNDLVYMTYYSETSPVRFYEKNSVQGFSGKIMRRDIAPEDIEAALRANSDTLLKTIPGYSTKIKNTTVSLIMVEKTTKGLIPHFKIIIESEETLITGTLSGAIVYDLY